MKPQTGDRITVSGEVGGKSGDGYYIRFDGGSSFDTFLTNKEIAHASNGANSPPPTVDFAEAMRAARAGSTIKFNMNNCRYRWYAGALCPFGSSQECALHQDFLDGSWTIELNPCPT